jgi:HlyD family secretion protein
VAQINEEIRGLAAQRESKEREIALIAEELTGVAELFKKNLVSIMRYMSLQRDQTRLQGERGLLIADLARARGRISEIELQIIQLDQDFLTEVLKELREIEGKLVELRERLTASEDQLKRIDIRAPQAGVVHQLSVHTTGGVVAPGETLMLIVPQSDELIVEARVAPQDVDQIVIGAPVTVRVMAGNQRVAPDVAGTVKHVSPDLVREQPASNQPGQAYFLVRIVLRQESVKQLGDLRLVPGMPVESFIETGLRTPLNYLVRPLWEQIARAFRER